MKFQIQEFCGLAAKQHPLHKDLKVFPDLAVPGVDHQLQLDRSMVAVDLELRGGNGIIDSVIYSDILLSNIE